MKLYFSNQDVKDKRSDSFKRLEVYAEIDQIQRQGRAES